MRNVVKVALIKMTSTDTLSRRGVHEVGHVLAEFGWYFREESISDHGIDAHVEAPDELGRPSGKLLALQIKAGSHWFSETSGTDIIFRGELRHLEYWSRFDLPIAIVLYDPKTYNCYWQLFSRDKVQPTTRSWKLRIPRRNVLDADALTRWRQWLLNGLPAAQTDPQVDVVIEYCRAQVEVTIAKVGKRYRPDLYISRQSDAQVRQALHAGGARTASALVLIERAGSGKTNLACHIALELVQSRSPCIFLLGSDPIDDRFGLVAEVLAGLGLDHEKASKRAIAQRAIRDALGGRSLTVVIDAINETRDVERMRDALAELFAQTTDIPVRYLVTCRDIYWSFLKGDWIDCIACKVQSLNLYRFDAQIWPDVRELYFRHFNILGTIKGEADEQCRHPLLFRFFCEAYRGEDVSVIRQIRLKPLFERYLAKKVERLAAASSADTFRPEDAYTGALDTIAATMLKTQQASIPETLIPELLHDPAHRRRDSVYVRLLDEDIILDEIPDDGADTFRRRVRFVYEAFLEFMLARVLSQQWHSLDAGRIVEELQQLLVPSSSMRNVLGALTFLDDFFARRGVRVWLELAERAPALQGQVLAALREADPSHLPKDMIDAFPALLRSSSQEVRSSALELLRDQDLCRSIDPEDRLLCQALKTDPRREVRLVAIEGLCSRWDTLSSANRLAVLEACVDKAILVRRKSIAMLTRASQGERAELLSLLLQTCMSDRSSLRSFATIALDLGLWPQVRPKLLDALDDPVHWVRRAALIRLRDYRDESDVARILSLIDDPHPAVRVLTAHLCRCWAIPELLAALQARLDVETDASVTSTIIATLSAVQASSAIGPLLGSLRHSSPRVRRRAARAVYRLLGAASMNELVPAFLQQRNPNDLWFVYETNIGDFGGPEGIRGLLRSRFSGAVLEPQVEAFVAGLFLASATFEEPSNGSLRIDELITTLTRPLLKSFLSGMRSSMQPLYGMMKNAPALEAGVGQLVFDEDVEVACHAAHVLAASAEAMNANVVERIASHPDATVRESFAWGLVRGLPRPKHLPYVYETLASPSLSYLPVSDVDESFVFEAELHSVSGSDDVPF